MIFEVVHVYRSTGFEMERSDALRGFRHFAACAARSHALASGGASRRGHPPPRTDLATWPRPREAGAKPLVTLYSRPPEGRRAVRNELFTRGFRPRP